MNVSIRDMNESDRAFQREMLYEAAFWRPAGPRPPMDQALAQPELAKLVESWGRPGDFGVVAIGGNGERLGAAWYRLWTDDNHSYGYIDDATPELAIAVVAGARGQGIGHTLLGALIARARSDGVPYLSLSVEKENPALKLYKSAGFEIVGTEGDAWTMRAAT